MSSPWVEQVAWARVVFECSVAAFAVGELSQAVKVRRGARLADWRAEIVFRATFFPGVLLIPFARSVVPHAVLGGATFFFAGLAIGWCGLLLRWWSFVTLGRYFTTVVKTSADQVVVARGPYRVLRHPSYTGLLAAFVGCGLVIGNWVGLLGSFVLILGSLVYRIQREERALTEALGEVYRDFAGSRARLVPYVW